MPAKRSRVRAHRRDRRKAKASNWHRDGKQGMGSRVGHGSGSNVGHVGTLKVASTTPTTFAQAVKQEMQKLRAQKNAERLGTTTAPLRASLGERLSTRRKP